MPAADNRASVCPRDVNHQLPLGSVMGSPRRLAASGSSIITLARAALSASLCRADYRILMPNGTPMMSG